MVQPFQWPQGLSDCDATDACGELEENLIGAVSE
jgi:hypothetical protein